MAGKGHLDVDNIRARYTRASSRKIVLTQRNEKLSASRCPLPPPPRNPRARGRVDSFGNIYRPSARNWPDGSRTVPGEKVSSRRLSRLCTEFRRCAKKKNNRELGSKALEPLEGEVRGRGRGGRKNREKKPACTFSPFSRARGNGVSSPRISRAGKHGPCGGARKKKYTRGVRTNVLGEGGTREAFPRVTERAPLRRRGSAPRETAVDSTRERSRIRRAVRRNSA